MDNVINVLWDITLPTIPIQIKELAKCVRYKTVYNAVLCCNVICVCLDTLWKPTLTDTNSNCKLIYLHPNVQNVPKIVFVTEK